MGTAHKKMTSHGSVSIPVAMRRSLGMEPKDPVVLEEQDGKITIRPYRHRCIICGAVDDEGKYRVHGKSICRMCAGKVVEATSRPEGGK